MSYPARAEGLVNRIYNEMTSCYIIAVGFFSFTLSFFVLYILPFGLVHGLGAHIECRCSRAREVDVTIRDVTIKTPDRK